MDEKYATIDKTSPGVPDIKWIEEQISHCSDLEFCQKLTNTLDILKSCLAKYQCSLSFNGGKDCTVLLFLIKSLADIPILVVEEPKWKEVDDFIDFCSEYYSMPMTKSKQAMKLALESFLIEHPSTAIFLGTRLGDPHTDGLTIEQPTDNGWPKITRLNPIMDWKYHDIWKCIRLLRIPYCRLYDQGYTSIGSPLKTKKNEHLLITEDFWLPAHALEDETTERCGRC